MKKLNIVFICVVLLVGCRVVDKLSNYDEYKKTSLYGTPLVLPRDIDKSSVENYYPVPKTENNSELSTAPPGLMSNPAH